MITETDTSILSGLYECLRLRFEELNVKDNAILELLVQDPDVSESDLEAEHEAIDGYTVMYYQCKSIVENKVRSNETTLEASSTSSYQSGLLNPATPRYQCKLPTLKLKEFSGSLEEWLPFWSQFQKIDEDPDLNPSDKLAYLTMCMIKGSPASNLVESYPATSAMYTEVVKALKERFGRNDLLTEFYIRDLLKIIIQNSKNKVPVSVLYDTVQSNLRNLRSLGIDSDNYAPILMPLVSSCVNEDLLQIWERSRVISDNNSSKDCLQSILKFLKDEVEASQRLLLSKQNFVVPKSHGSHVDKDTSADYENEPANATAAGLVNISKRSNCLFCSGNHRSQECRKADQWTLSQKESCVREKNVCYSCLQPGHIVKFCKNRPKCKTCGRRHFEVMCDNLHKNKKESSNVNPFLCSDSENTKSLSSTCTVRSDVLLQTTVVKVKNAHNDWLYARLLVDPGSQQSYILDSTATQIGYKPFRKDKIQHALFGGAVTNVLEHNVYKILVSDVNDSNEYSFDVYGQSKICSPISCVPPGPWIEELKQENIHLSDMKYPTTDIEILVGSDVAGKLYTGKRFELSCGLVALETLLGWTLSGKLPSTSGKSNNTSQATLVTSLLIKDANNVSDLWALDVLGITDPTNKMVQADIDKATYDHFLSTVKVNEDDRFEVQLPFVGNHPPLSSNYNLSMKRLESTINRLKKDGYYETYQKVLDSWEEKGIIEKVAPGKVQHYLPHRHVIKSNSTTPVRPVFDASAHGIDSPSLNDCLEKGPNLLEKIPACLARFRAKSTGVSGDIEKAFLQIAVSAQDRNFLGFLWKDITGKVQTYRHCRVVFGVASSPFLLEATLKLLIDLTLSEGNESKVQWPVHIVEALRDSFYVDNCLTSVDSVQEANEFMNAATSILSVRKFNLRGWELSGETGSYKPSNVLGLLWDKEKDTLGLNIESLNSMQFDIVTKKILLSAAHRLYDPIGMVSSVGLIPKLLIQKTWEENLTWNEEVNPEIRAKFCQWMKEIPLLSQVQIPRWIADSDEPKDHWSIHVFSDACKYSYACAIFLRIEHDHGVTVRLLAARSRVAPTSKSKTLTIPRAELLAASIAARLYVTVVDDYKLSGVSTTFWTDASTVLAWIKHNEPWNVFVMNRISEIRLLTKGHPWRHIPGELNPADLPSRGCSPKKYVQSQWWKGPSWLKQRPEDWPQGNESFSEEEVMAERKKTVVSSMLSNIECIDNGWYGYFSQFNKTVRMIGWIMRFVTNCRLKPDERVKRDLTTEEFKSAEQKVFILIQSETLTDMSKLSHLVPFTEDGLIRLKTKVSNRPDSKDFCHPIVLPGKHLVVQQMILHIHKEQCHAGTQLLMTKLRERFWILGGRKVIKTILNACFACKRYTVKKVETIPTPLPEDRVRDAKVFEVTGIDLAGPLYLKGDNEKSRKVWIVVFTCAVYRAVRLELVSSLSTDRFLQAFNRFCSRQGRPEIVYSDQGTNFVGFDGACAKLNWDAISQYSSAKRIKWNFNPPSAPWWGGWWERLIGILKKLLRRTLGNVRLDYEEMLTILYECESVINSRPLTYLSEDPTDLAVLTPHMFLQDIQEVGFPEYDLLDVDLKGRMRYRSELKSQLRERFRVEYLGQLKLLSGKEQSHCINLGDLVLIGDDNNKRSNWPLGRVTELIKGNDGEVRVVRVRTSSGILIRPVQRLYVLESLQICENSCSNEKKFNDSIHPTIELDKDMDSDSDSDGGSELPVAINKITTRHGRVVNKPSRFV